MTSDSPGGRPPRKGERTRQQILRAAGKLLASQAPSSIRMDDIAYAAGVSIGTVYNYFASRDALLLAFTADAYDVFDRYRAEISEIDSPLQRVYRAGDKYLEFAIHQPSFVRFMMVRGLQPSHETELAEINVKVAGRVRELVMQSGVDLREAMEIGEIPPAPIDELAVMLFAIWNGMAALIVRADETAIPSELAWRALVRSRVILRRAIQHEFEHPAAIELADWELAPAEFR